MVALIRITFQADIRSDVRATVTCHCQQSLQVNASLTGLHCFLPHSQLFRSCLLHNRVCKAPCALRQFVSVPLGALLVIHAAKMVLLRGIIDEIAVFILRDLLRLEVVMQKKPQFPTWSKVNPSKLQDIRLNDTQQWETAFLIKLNLQVRLNQSATKSAMISQHTSMITVQGNLCGDGAL